jgi:DeoR/GlpR family transcriptional regulator of sugar metabolism
MQLLQSRSDHGGVVVSELNLLPETASAVISIFVAGIATVIGLVLNKRFKFIRDLKKSLTVDDESTIHNADPKSVIAQTEDLFRKQAATILNVVRPYHSHDPISIFELHRRLVDRKETELTLQEFQTSLVSLLRQDRLPGIKREHDNLYIHEEHISWKKQVASAEKTRIALRAYSYIKSGDIVALDAGTTTLEIAKLIGAGFRDKALQKITVVTNSFLVADAIVSSCAELGLEDHDPMFRLFIVGGRVRLNTMAIVDDNTSVAEEIFHDFDQVLPALGGADIGFAGTNGVLKDIGFTTADPGEKRAKASLLLNSKKRFIVCDDEKFGLRQAQVFATFSDGITIITAENKAKYALADYTSYFKDQKTDMIIA